MATITAYSDFTLQNVAFYDLLRSRTNYSLQSGANIEINGVVYPDLYISYSGPDQGQAVYLYGSDFSVDPYGNFVTGSISGVSQYTFSGTSFEQDYRITFDAIPYSVFFSTYSFQLLLASAAFSGNDFIYGSDGNDTLSGENGSDYIYGGAGDDTIGRSLYIYNIESGNDIMVGGAGNDVYFTDGDDTIVENTDEGVDTVYSSASYKLAENIENLTLVDPVFFSTEPINATGNNLNNILTGNNSSNILDGGLGADVLAGGGGDDTYITDGDDTIIEELYGIDTVLSSGDYSLGENLENLTLVGLSAVIGTGNGLNNVLTGSDADNLLNGHPGNDHIFGGVGDDTLIGGAGFDYLSGGDGNDTYVIDDLSFDTLIEGADAGIDTVQYSGEGGPFSFGNTYQLQENFENLVLAGAAALNGVGNSLNNRLVGNVASNRLSAGEGSDVLIGGLGDDTYIIDGVYTYINGIQSGYIFDGGDTVIEAANEGTDTVESSVTYTLDEHIENLILLDSFNTYGLPINGTGNSLNNVLTGSDGSNVLDGGTGVDTLIGRNGEDTYITDGDDTIIEDGNDIFFGPDGITYGVDTVRSSATYVLGANLEDLVLTGLAAINGMGNTLNNVLTGNEADNILNGGDGEDTLVGAGGIDTLIGGNGDDSYFTDGTDLISEDIDAGIDTVSSHASYTLGLNIERLILTGTSAIDGGGNALDNVISGNTANNTLNGGTGIDSLSGGLGDDIYITDGGDSITENASSGTDLVRSSATHSLGLNLENLTLTGAAAINGFGNSLNNIITGNRAANTLNGGLGSDVLIGGLGDDIYIINGDDTITEASAAGTDTVRSSVTYTLGVNVENLVLLGNTAINGSGNGLSNFLTGNGAANTLNGGSGADFLKGGGGKDTLVGGAGDDTFVFDLISDSSTTASTSDVISDFVRVRDKIDLSLIDSFARSGANDTFLWKGAAAFNNAAAGEVRYQQFDSVGTIDDYTFVYLDNDADSAAEMTIRLTGLYTLAATDFFL